MGRRLTEGMGGSADTTAARAEGAPSTQALPGKRAASAGLAGPGPNGVIAPRARELLVDDLPLAPHQMLKGDFFAELERELRELVGADCPYLTRYLERYRTAPAAKCELFIHRWIAEWRTASDAQELVTLVVERARAAAREWRETRQLRRDLRIADPIAALEVPASAANEVGVAPGIERADGQQGRGLATETGIVVGPDAAPETVAHELVHVAQAQQPAEQDRGRDAAEVEAATLARQFVETGSLSAPRCSIDLSAPAGDDGAKGARPADRLHGRPFAVEGDASDPRVIVSAGWMAKQGVKRGFVGEITGATHPKLLRALVAALLPLYPYAKQRGSDPLADVKSLTLGVNAELWKSGEQELGVARGLFLHIGLPPERPVQVFPTADGVEIMADTAYSYPKGDDATARTAARRALVKLALEGLEQRIGAPLDPARRALLEGEVDKIFGDQTEKVVRATISMDVLAEYFGDQAVGAYAQGAHGEGGAVITAGGRTLLILARDEAEKQEVLRVLREIFGEAAAAPDGAKGEVLLPADIEALLKFDTDLRRDELLAILREMQHGPAADPKRWNAPTVRDLIARARERLETRDADKKTKREATEKGYDGILPYPVPGKIVDLNNGVNLGMRAQFEFHVSPTADPREWRFADPWFFHQPETTIDWYAVKVDESGKAQGAPEAHEQVHYRDAKPDGWLNDKRFEHRFEKAGTYEVHAYVAHSMFQPAHFKHPVEVVTEEDRLKRFEHLASETWGVEVSREDKVFRGVDANRVFLQGTGDEAVERERDKHAHKYARGSRAEGRLTDDTAGDPGGGAHAERLRLEVEIEEMDDLEAQYPSNDRRSEAMRDYARERREKLEKSLERTNEAFKSDVLPVQVQGNYASRTHGVASGALHLVSYFRFHDHSYFGELLDHSEIVRSEHFRFRQAAPGYEAMMEKLFDDLTIAYPDGSMSFAFQMYEGLKPTDRFVRYTRHTDTVQKDFMEAAYDDKTRVAVNLIALILSLFPPTAPLGVGLGLVYNSIDVLNQLDDAMRTDTVTTAKVVDVGLLALDILPAIGTLSKTTRIGRTTYHLIEATQLAGSVYLLADGVQAGIVDIHDRLLKQLAEKHQELAQLQHANAASPEVARLAQEIRGLEGEIHSAAKTVFTQVAATQGLQLASTAVIRHIAGDLFARRPGDVDGDADDDLAAPPAHRPGGTRGRAVYDLHDVGELTTQRLKNALDKLPHDRPNARYAPHHGDLKGKLEVAVANGTKRKVDVEYVLVPELDPARQHDGDAGPGSVYATPPTSPGGRWTAKVEVSSRLEKKDVTHVVGHELDEVVEIVRRYEADPTISIDAEHEASMFRPGAPAGAQPSAHDVAAARELDGLFEAARRASEDYSRALAERSSGSGASVPQPIFTRHANAVKRLHRKLEAMGFADGSDPSRRLAMLEQYATKGDELRAFVERFLDDPSSQLPDPVAATKHVLLKPQAEALEGLGIDESLAQRLLDKGVIGPDIVDVAKAGNAKALSLLEAVIDDSQHAKAGVGLVKELAIRGELDAGLAAAPSLQRFVSETIAIHDILDRLRKGPPEHFEALSWLVGHPDRSRRLLLPTAERTLALAAQKGVTDKVQRLLRSGALRNPQSLAHFIEALKEKAYGDRLSLDYAIEHAANYDVTLEGRHGDLAIHERAPGSRIVTTVQAKSLESTTKQAFVEKVVEAVYQLRGERGEPAADGSAAVALIRLPADHELFHSSKAQLIETLRETPSTVSALAGRKPGQGPGWDRIEVRGKSTHIISPDNL